MSKKYIGQITNTNFVYPNNKLAEYDVEIVHDLKEDSVTGTTTGFDMSYNTETGNIHFSFTYQWYLNNAEPYISNDNKLNVLSVHMMSNDKKYFKPWICVGLVQRDNTSLTYVTDTQNFIVSPAMVGQTSFTSGRYFVEVRMMGKRAVYPLNYSDTVGVPVTPTPTPTPGGPTPTPTPTSTPVPYFTATWGNTCEEAQAKCSGGAIPVYDFTRYSGTGTTMCDMEWIVNDTLFNSGEITGSTFFTVQCGAVPQVLREWHMYLPPLGGSFRAYQYGACALCPGATPTPTPTPTATSVGPTSTPTPTPTSVPPTSTPTPTPTSTTFYDIVGYSSNDATVCTSPISSFSMSGNGTTFCNSTTFTSSGWYTIPSGSYYLSYGGNTRNVTHTTLTNIATTTDGGCAACPAAPTPTPTPTPTPAPPSFYYYTLTRYTCIGCGGAATGYVGRSSTTLTTNYYYCPVDDPAHTYKVTSSIGGTYYDIDLDGSTPGASCNVSCAN